MPEAYSPYPFTQEDLQIDRLTPGVYYTLGQFYEWRDNNPQAVGAFIEQCHEQLEIAKSEYSHPARIIRRILPFAQHRFDRQRMIRDLEVFGIRNLAEIPDQDKLTAFSESALAHEKKLEMAVLQSRNISAVLRRQFSIPEDSPEMMDIEERLRTLYQILPEKVIQQGAMGKVARTIFGVGAIAAYDLLGVDEQEKRDHLNQTVHGAVVFGASYAIIDDTLHDLHSKHMSLKDRQRYHELILQGLRTGQPIDTTHLPDVPLTDEIKNLYNMFTRYYPIERYPHIYQAAESMYMAQHRDMQLTMESAEEGDIRDLYPDIFIKSGMSRVIANILGRRQVDPDFYRRCLNTMMVHQFEDDLVDYKEDREESRVTSFTHPNKLATTNPLYDIVAYDAYIASTVHPGADSTIAYAQSIFLANYLSVYPDRANELLDKFRDNSPEVLVQLIVAASQLPESVIKPLISVDQKLKRAIASYTSQRPQTDVHPQTFIMDRLEIINQVIKDFINRKEADSPNKLVEIMKYVLEAGGKRLRPAITLMLAESLDVDPMTIQPILLASELFQTSSLLFDDLPWQDNSATRRGKPTAHTIYNEASVELTGIFMLLGGASALQELKNSYPSGDVVNITKYTTEAIQRICEGQNMDLQMAKMNKADITLDDVLTMYHLKTAVAIEASLVPLMILQKRPAEEIELIKKYAHHAGLVFQLKDDLLDMSSNVEDLGKDVQQDTAKVNIVRMYGEDMAYEIMNYHLQEAVDVCRRLPFNTNLLQGTVTYFAKRKR